MDIEGSRARSHAVERTRSDAALRQQKQRLSLALEASAGGSWTWEAATNQVDWDQRFRELYGFTPDEPAAPDKWGRRVHEDDRQRTFALADAVLTSKTLDSWENTFRIVRPDGGLRWVQSRGRADRDADGNVTRITGLDLDFTRYHHAEEALRAGRDEEHHRTLRTLLETATQGIVSADARGIVDFANRAAEVMFGWAAEELVGQEIDRLIPSLLRDGAVADGGLDLLGARKDGSTFPIEVSLNHVPTPGGGRIFAFVTDITERRRAAAVLQERTTELEYRTTQLTQMAWDLTLAEHHAREEIAKTLHDGLQQLLVIVAMNLELHLKQEADDGGAPSLLLTEAKQQLDEAMAAARSLNLELFPPVLHRSGLPAALTWLANWTQDKYKLEVQIAADPRADSARRDVRTLLFESARELLFNVVKHAQADRVTLELVLRDDDQLCITVTDPGVGFEPARLDDRSHTGQLGWGLFRIRERLTLLGGRFDVKSAPGLGTRVRLIAPRGEAQDTAAETLELDSASSGAAAASDKAGASPAALRVLIVDDHPAVRIALRAILHQQPQLSVVGDASNGVEAISHAYTLRPDVILMDVAMPHMDGIEATTRIRAELPDIRILGLSMQSQRETAHAIEQAGAAGFFVKGTDTQRLVDELLDFHASRGAKQQADA
jgi:PAS domain S-box-containing protein